MVSSTETEPPWLFPRYAEPLKNRLKSNFERLREWVRDFPTETPQLQQMTPVGYQN